MVVSGALLVVLVNKGDLYIFGRNGGHFRMVMGAVVFFLKAWTCWRCESDCGVALLMESGQSTFILKIRFDVAFIWGIILCFANNYNSAEHNSVRRMRKTCSTSSLSLYQDFTPAPILPNPYFSFLAITL